MRTKMLALACLFAAYGSSVFAAAPFPGQNHLANPLQYPGAPKPVYDDQHSPYAMTYTDEVAQNLGVKDGHMDVFSTQPQASGYMPSISGGVGGDGAMLRLRWHPGE